MIRQLLIASVMILAFSLSAFAHLPTVGQGQFDSRENAFHIHDIDVSLVIYEEFRAPDDRLWMEFEAEAGHSVQFSLGLPQLESVRELRPSMALIGPGLPRLSENGLPFEIPYGMGGILYETDEVENPEAFHEPFADTHDWELGEWDVELPESGTYYFVVFSPRGHLGKYWVVTGYREAFGPSAIAQLPDWIAEVREYHELQGLAAWQRWFRIAAVGLMGLAVWFLALRS